jgi:hypothetical protein
VVAEPRYGDEELAAFNYAGKKSMFMWITCAMAYATANHLGSSRTRQSLSLLRSRWAQGSFSITRLGAPGLNGENRHSCIFDALFFINYVGANYWFQIVVFIIKKE